MQLPKQVSGSGEDKRLEILNQAYESAWERINGQKEGFRNLATRVLAWISSAKRPLSTKELQHALAVKIGLNELDEDAIPQVQDMVSFCAGLVTVDEESDVIRLAHYTTQEFFDRKKSDWFPNVEAMIAETCISYLSLGGFGKYFLKEYNLDESNLEEAGPDNSYLDEYELTESNLDYLQSYGLYEYSSFYWGDHARIAGRQLDESVIGFLMSGAKASTAFHVMLYRFPMSEVVADPVGYFPYEFFSYLHPELFSLVSGLHLAVHFELYEAINMLLKIGCDINGRKGLELTPLLMAIDNGHTGIAEMLLDNGAHMGAVSGLSLLYLSVAMQPKNYSESLVQRLIAMGINDGEDFSLYLMPAARFGHEAIVKLLLDKGANINVVDGNTWTPLHTAVINDQEATMKLLLDKGANTEVASDEGTTPLHYAVEHYDGVAVKLLLDEGANIEAADNRGKRPLHYTAAYGSEAIVKLLLDKGADVEAADNDGWRPLHVAYDNAEMWPEKRPWDGIHSEKYAIVKMLIDKGANIDATDHRGRTPLDIAKENNQQYLKWESRKHGACQYGR